MPRPVGPYIHLGRRKRALPAQHGPHVPAGHEPHRDEQNSARLSGLINRERTILSQRRGRLAEANPAAYLPDLAMSLTTPGTGWLTSGRSGEADQAWEDATARLGPETHVLRLPQAGWEWVLTPIYEAERDHLAPHPGVLVPGSEDQLARVLRYQPPDEAKRYLALLQTARVHGIDDAYRDLH